MTDLNKKTNLLIEELYNYFVFYIPKSAVINLFEQNVLEREKLPSFKPFWDKVCYIDKGHWYWFEKTPFELIELTFKTNNLSENVMKLFEFKENLQPDTFDYILKKYKRQLEFHVTITAILVESYEKFCVEKSKNIKDILKLQQSIISNHTNEIITNFEKAKQETTHFAIPRLTNFSLLKKEITNPDSEIQPFLLNKKPKKKELSQEAAIAYLLKTVFTKKN